MRCSNTTRAHARLRGGFAGHRPGDSRQPEGAVSRLQAGSRSGARGGTRRAGLPARRPQAVRQSGPLRRTRDRRHHRRGDALARFDGPAGGCGPPWTARGRRDPDSSAAYADRHAGRPDRPAEVRSASDCASGVLDPRAFRAARHGRGDGRLRPHERVVISPALQSGHLDEPAAIPEGAAAARSAAADAVSENGRERGVPPCRLPESVAVQQGVRPFLRQCPDQGYRPAAGAGVRSSDSDR